jgi:hypothetical protein
MEENRIYLQPTKMVYNAVLDLMELQKGEQIVNEVNEVNEVDCLSSGRVHFHIVMYGFAWEVRFIITDIEKNRCGVIIDISEIGPAGGGGAYDQEDQDDQDYLADMIRREYAILDSLLLLAPPVEFWTEGRHK